MADPIDYRTRAAWHESGHATMGWLLDVQPDVVSIAPGEHRGGVWIGLSADDPVGPDAHLHRRDPAGGPLARHGILPVPMFDSYLRWRTERSILIDLAGRESEYLAGRLPDGYLPEDEDLARAEARAAALVGAGGLSESQAASLEHSGRTASPSDEDQAFAAAARIERTPAAAVAHVSWLREVARAVVRTPFFYRLVAPLAAALLEHETIAGELAAAILEREVSPPGKPGTVPN